MLSWFQIGYMLREIALRDGTARWTIKGESIGHTRQLNYECDQGWKAHHEVADKL